MTLPSPPDGVAYVERSQVWVTTPRTHSLTIIERGAIAGTIALDGEPEGYAVDTAGHFFTNLEDRDLTLVIDVATHAITKSLHPHCGAAGPRGLAPAGTRIVVACTDHLAVVRSRQAIACCRPWPQARAWTTSTTSHPRDRSTRSRAKMRDFTIATLDDAGVLTLSTSAPTSSGTRVVVSDAQGNAYVGDAAGAAMWIFSPDWNVLASAMAAGDARAILYGEKTPRCLRRSRRRHAIPICKRYGARVAISMSSRMGWSSRPQLSMR